MSQRFCTCAAYTIHSVYAMHPNIQYIAMPTKMLGTTWGYCIRRKCDTERVEIEIKTLLNQKWPTMIEP